MTVQCSKSKWIRGLFVQALSSNDGAAQISSIGARTDVKHWVTVENLGGYPADICCRGRIPSTQPMIKFDSARTSDTATVWTDSHQGLPDQKKWSFSHVTLLPTSSGNQGTEIIHSDLEVTWPQPARKKTPSLSIQVSS